ncbi:MAG: putative xanthine dehydrogenase, molybdenum-binding subunit, partial [Phycisphaerales bacterium]|nr:putative xanthine dehydrogenase, molybdenum-binding subunit [Phycisphaerales bacterium]
MISLPKMPKELGASGPHMGKNVSRVDGLKKVTGAAKYAAEFNTPNLAHGYIVNS